MAIYKLKYWYPNGEKEKGHFYFTAENDEIAVKNAIHYKEKQMRLGEFIECGLDIVTKQSENDFK